MADTAVSAMTISNALLRDIALRFAAACSVVLHE
jgi:hypothetical protein